MAYPLELRALVLDHHVADVALRGTVALDPEGQRAALADPSRPAAPALLLSTCNRLELYWIGDATTATWWRARLGPAAAGRLTGFAGRAAARHLLRVAAGLESQLLGEAEILGQLRRAAQGARAAGALDATLQFVVERVLAGARRVRAETFAGGHAASVSAAALRQAAQVYGGTLDGAQVLVLGAGEAARAALAALPSLQPAHVTLLNRHPGRGRQAAAAAGVTDVRPWEALADAAADADVIVCATAAREPVLTRTLLATLPARPRGRTVLDLAVPANVEPAARTLPGLRLLDLDDLRTRCCPAAQVGTVQLLAAEALVEREVRRLGAALRLRTRTAALGAIHELGARLAEEEAARTLASLGGSLGEAERRAVEQLADRVARRVLYPVGRLLRDGAA